MSVILDEEPKLIMGARIANGVKLEKTFKKLVKVLAEDQPNLADMIKFDAEEYEGVKFHVVAIPVPDPKAEELFGEKVHIVLGTSESAIYFGAGKDPIPAIKKAMDASKAAPGKAIDPFRMVFSLSPVAKFFSKVIPDNADAQAKKNFGTIVEVLEKFGGKDHVTVTLKPIPGGARMRLNVEPGVIKSILDVHGGE